MQTNLFQEAYNKDMAEKKKGHTQKHQHVRIGGRLHQETTLYDELGNLVHRAVSPLMIEFYPRDVLQTIVGAIILAVPMAFTDEVWRIGAELPTSRILLVSAVSIFAIATFVYYNIYKAERGEGFSEMFKRGDGEEFIKRVIGTYVVALTVSFVLLWILDRAPLTEHIMTTLHRAVLVALPASMSASVADILK